MRLPRCMGETYGPSAFDPNGRGRLFAALKRLADHRNLERSSGASISRPCREDSSGRSMRHEGPQFRGTSPLAGLGSPRTGKYPVMSSDALMTVWI